MSGEYNGRVALITGASRGIGLATAHRLAAEGAALVLSAHPADADELAAAAGALEAGGAHVISAPHDLCSEGAAAELVALAGEQHGSLDVAIANAGVSATHDWIDAPAGSFAEVIDVNLSATHELLKAVASRMQSHNGGAIAVTASTSAWLGYETQVEYNTSKAGVVAMTRSLAVALAPSGIRVNAVAPGWVATEMTRDRLVGPIWEQVREMIPMNRAAGPEEVADVFAWLCSERASYVTGAVIAVDGGMTAGLVYPS